MSEVRARTRLPLVLLTGFLGSGKTTLLRQLLQHESWADTAVLINELGSAPLDHHQVWNTGAEVALVGNGCICCGLNGDLTGTLEELFWQRLRRELPQFRRVVIETTGLADPRPIVAALRAHALVAQRYRLDAIVCTVDAEYGALQLQAHPESRAQAACADVHLLTKCDRVDAAQVEALEEALDALNPAAARYRVHGGTLAPAALDELLRFAQEREQAPGRAAAQAAAALAADVPLAVPGSHLFHRRVAAYVIRFDRPWPLEQLEQALHRAAQAHGESVFRMKGLFELDDGSHVVANAVYGTVFPLEPLTVAGVSGNFLVCIGSPEPRSAIEDLFERVAGAAVVVKR